MACKYWLNLSPIEQKIEMRLDWLGGWRFRAVAWPDGDGTYCVVLPFAAGAMAHGVTETDLQNIFVGVLFFTSKEEFTKAWESGDEEMSPDAEMENIETERKEMILLAAESQARRAATNARSDIAWHGQSMAGDYHVPAARANEVLNAGMDNSVLAGTDNLGALDDDTL